MHGSTWPRTSSRSKAMHEAQGPSWSSASVVPCQPGHCSTPWHRMDGYTEWISTPTLHFRHESVTIQGSSWWSVMLPPSRYLSLTQTSS